GVARLRLDGDFAVVVTDEAPDDVEAKAGTQTDRLGGEERVEDPFADVGRNSRAVVDNPYGHTLMLAIRPHLDAARVGNGIERVVDEIRPNLIELADEPADAG